MAGIELGHQRRDLLDGLPERLNIGQLGTDVHLQTPKADVGELGCPSVDGLDGFELDAELVVVSASGDLGVRVSIDIRIYPHGHRGDFLELHRHLADARQLGLGFDIEAINTLLQSERDLLLGLADSSKDAFARITASGNDSLDLTSTHRVEPASEVRKGADHSEIGVGLHGEADQVIHGRQCGIELGVVVGQGGLRIDVKRRSVLLDQVRKRDILAEEFPTDIAKRMHLRVLCHRADPEINRDPSLRPQYMKKGGRKPAAFIGS